MTNLEYANLIYSFRSFEANLKLVHLVCGEELDEFSSRACDVCETRLAGKRFELIGFTARQEKDKFSVCTDCYYYAEYGQLDDMSMLEINETEVQDWLFLLIQGIEIKQLDDNSLEFKLRHGNDSFIITISETGIIKENKAQVGYTLAKDGQIIFDAADIQVPYEVLTPKTFETVLGFLTLRLGDTDREYFDSYNETQIEFRDTYAEYLSAFALEFSAKEKELLIENYFHELN